MRVQCLAFRRLCVKSLRTFWFAAKSGNLGMFWWAAWRQMRDAFRALFAGCENARALVSAWGGRKVFDGLRAPYGAHRDDGLYCVECLDSVPSGFYQEHQGRCWYCDHVMTHSSPRVAKYFASLYQERY